MEVLNDPQLNGFYSWEMTSIKLAGELLMDQYKGVASRVGMTSWYSAEINQSMEHLALEQVP